MISVFVHFASLLICVAGLSGWMRYDGFFINGHTRREIPSVTSEEDCWSFCLMESRFDCLAVAYAARGNHSCLLYDVRALSVVGDWTPSEYFTYFEFCVNGTLSWTKYTSSALYWNSLPRIYDSNEEECKRACERMTSCYSVDLRLSDRICFPNNIIGLDAGSDWRAHSNYVHYGRCHNVTYGRAFTLNFVRPGSDSKFYELGTLDTVGHPVVYTVKAHNAEECAMHCMNDGGCKGFVVGHNTDGTATAVCNIVSD